MRRRLGEDYLEAVGFKRRGRDFVKRLRGREYRLRRLTDGTFEVPDEISDILLSVRC